GEHRPEQQVAVLRPARDVGGEVARVDVRDRGDERRPEEGPERAQPAPLPLERLLRGPQRRRLAGEDATDDVARDLQPRVQPRTSTRIACVSRFGSSWVVPALVTVRPRAVRSTISTESPGR